MLHIGSPVRGSVCYRLARLSEAHLGSLLWSRFLQFLGPDPDLNSDLPVPILVLNIQAQPSKADPQKASQLSVLPFLASPT